MRVSMFVQRMVIVSVLAVILPFEAALAGVLEEYVATPDAAYSFQVGGTTSGPGYQVHFLEMTSQEWPRMGHPARRPWKHAIALVVPAQVSFSTALVFVGGGTNTPPLRVSTSELQLAVQLAIASQSMVALLAQVPNQPWDVDGAGTQLSEDALVAYTWDKALDTGALDEVVYLPMTKSVVRAMDTVQSYSRDTLTQPISSFVVTGFSKRGAATWLSAAVDPRVQAIAPGVFDFLDMPEQAEYHYAAYGFFAPAVQDYEAYDVLRRLRTPEGTALRKVVDPISYKRSLTLPKLLVNSTGDQFFTPDSSQRYQTQLSGETRVRYVPNTDHSLSTPDRGPEDALLGVLGWYQSILTNTPRARVQSFATGDELVVKTSGGTPLSAALWTATNQTARDFRRTSIGASWTQIALTPDPDGTYRVPLAKPSQGWAAQFVEVRFVGAVLPQVFSTPVYITPNSYPHRLDDPIADPRNEHYWRHRLQAELSNANSTLHSAFPMPVLGRTIGSLEDASEIMSSRGQSGLRKCLASRLNIADGRIGWYSGPIGRGTDSVYPVLFLWNVAHEVRGSNEAAGIICESINGMDN